MSRFMTAIVSVGKERSGCRALCGVEVAEKETPRLVGRQIGPSGAFACTFFNGRNINSFCLLLAPRVYQAFSGEPIVENLACSSLIVRIRRL